MHRTRAQEAAQAESLQEREREKELLDLTQLDPGRCEHLGYDRHWNRYWLFGAWGRHSEGDCWVCASVHGLVEPHNCLDGCCPTSLWAYQ